MKFFILIAFLIPASTLAQEGSITFAPEEYSTHADAFSWGTIEGTTDEELNGYCRNNNIQTIIGASYPTEEINNILDSLNAMNLHYIRKGSEVLNDKIEELAKANLKQKYKKALGESDKEEDRRFYSLLLNYSTEEKKKLFYQAVLHMCGQEEHVFSGKESFERKIESIPLYLLHVRTAELEYDKDEFNKILESAGLAVPQYYLASLQK